MKEFLERFKPHINCWMAKKSRKPMCTGKYPPCFLLKSVNLQKGKIHIKGKAGNPSIFLTKQTVDNFEVVETSEAARLNKLFHESKIFGEDIVKETCFRKDGVTPKRCHSKETFPAALYELKIKYPNEECVAYKCSKCNQFHIGKATSIIN